MALEIGLKSFKCNSTCIPEGQGRLCCLVILFTNGFCPVWPDPSALDLTGPLLCQLSSSPAVSVFSCFRHNHSPVLQIFPAFILLNRYFLVSAFSIHNQLQTFYQMNVIYYYFVPFDTFVHTLLYCIRCSIYNIYVHIYRLTIAFVVISIKQ